MKVRLICLLTVALQHNWTLGQSNEDLRLDNEALELVGNHEYERAIPILDGLLLKFPDRIHLINARAISYANVKDYRNALRDYRFLLNLDSTNSEYYFQIGNMYEGLDSLNKAEKFYSLSIKKDSGDFMTFFKRGTVYLKESKFWKALDDFNKSISLNQEYSNSYHNRGIARYKLNDKVGGCEDWCTALLKGSYISTTHLEKNCKDYPEPCLLQKR